MISRVCGNPHAIIRKYGLMCCRQCFRSNAKEIGFVKVCSIFCFCFFIFYQSMIRLGLAVDMESNDSKYLITFCLYWMWFFVLRMICVFSLCWIRMSSLQNLLDLCFYLYLVQSIQHPTCLNTGHCSSVHSIYKLYVS